MPRRTRQPWQCARLEYPLSPPSMTFDSISLDSDDVFLSSERPWYSHDLVSDGHFAMSNHGSMVST
eukprot:146880-Hanusia_phi.AAC.1